MIKVWFFFWLCMKVPSCVTNEECVFLCVVNKDNVFLCVTNMDNVFLGGTLVSYLSNDRRRL